MKFLMYSESGEGAQILKKIQLEGNTVGLYIHDPVYQTVFDGLLPKLSRNSLDNFIDRDTIIIFDMSGNGRAADMFRKRGYFVYGGSHFADELELNRDFGLDVMRECGIKTPKVSKFTAREFEFARELIQSSDKKWVFKPSGDIPTKLTFVASDKRQLIEYLKYVEKHFGKEIENFLLQEFIEGTVVSSEAFCDGRGFLRPWNHTVENKKFMNDDLGPSTGCSGNITWPCDTSKIFDVGCRLAESVCIDNQYVGQIDLNAVVTESGEVYGLEWTPRFGYDATPTFLTLLDTEVGKFFSDITRKQIRDRLPVHKAFAGGIRLSIPPYPIEPDKKIEKPVTISNVGIPIQNFEKYVEDCYFYEVMCKEEGKLVHSNGTGVILCALGIGAEAQDSLAQPMKICEEISIPDKQYRTDLDEVLPNMVDEVLQHLDSKEVKKHAS